MMPRFPSCVHYSFVVARSRYVAQLEQEDKKSFSLVFSLLKAFLTVGEKLEVFTMEEDSSRDHLLEYLLN